MTCPHPTISLTSILDEENTKDCFDDVPQYWYDCNKCKTTGLQPKEFIDGYQYNGFENDRPVYIKRIDYGGER